ncbi:MAG TPA: SMC family ATPase, partial [Nocardioides sp.]|uniref:SMC family ATPase n=1 Tax=Nocardioides sp. TaxID=35761 RepID=UPI002EDA5F97
ESMAAELAGGLAVGGSCPVCGSCEHPHKASATADAPDAAAEKAAQKDYDDAKSAEHLRDVEVRELAFLLTQAESAATGDRTRLAADLAGAETVAARSATLAAEVEALRAEQQTLAERRLDLERQRSAAQADLRHLAAEEQELRGALDAALAAHDADDTGDAVDDIATLVDRLDRTLADIRRGLAALETARQAAATVEDAAAELEAACRDAGFDAADDAVAAALSPTELDDRAARVQHHERRLAAVTEVLREPGADAVATDPLPDLPALTAAHATALDALATAQAAVQRGVTRLARITTLQDELAAQLAAWGPLRAELELASRLAAFVEGKSADNQLQMSLSAYVVAYRLTQVVAAANERLATMSDRRYSLEHSLQKGAGDRRGGLALTVRDDWSGESRDPATLSGGETFVVSLALALGLADVITREAGGADLDTLFVDEGFGSLDADTLDDVLDVLDGLRDGGRVVGVVSHVAEMRDRIPAQLVVTKRRTGSAVSLSGA